MGEFDESLHYDKGNKYERASSLALDMDILGTQYNDVLDLVWTQSPHMSDAQRERMKKIVSDCEAQNDDWGIKDPRMCLTYELWAEELPPHKLIVIYRDSAQVWPWFKWLGKRKYLTNFNRAYSYLHRWQEHNHNILRLLASSPNENIILGYHELMTDDSEFARLQNFVGRPLADRRKPELYRSKSRQDIFIRFADWLLARRTGSSTDDTMNDLRAARARQIG